MSMQSDIEQVIRKSVAEALDVFKRNIFSAGSAADTPAKPRAKKGEKTEKPRKTASKKPGEKRSPEAMAELMVKAAEWIKANPGQGVEAIGKGLGVETKDLALPLKKLLADKKITTTGQKRATKYFPPEA